MIGNFLKKLQNATIIPLIKSERNWKIKIIVKGKDKNVTLDSGSDTILSLKDSLTAPNDGIKLTRSSGGINSFKNNLENRDKNIFIDFTIGDILFKETIISIESESNLLGIPLFWEYERVVLDFIDHKMYVFKKSNNKNTYSITNINKMTKATIEKIKEQKPVPN